MAPMEPDNAQPPPQPLPAVPIDEQLRVFHFLHQYRQALFAAPRLSVQVVPLHPLIPIIQNYLFGEGGSVDRGVLLCRYHLLGSSFLPHRPDHLSLLSDLVTPYDIFGFSHGPTYGRASSVPNPGPSPFVGPVPPVPTSLPSDEAVPAPWESSVSLPERTLPLDICVGGHPTYEEALIEVDQLFYPYYHKKTSSRPRNGRWGFACFMDGCGWRAAIKRVDQSGQSTYVTSYSPGQGRKFLPLRDPLPAHIHPPPEYIDIDEFPLTQHLQTLIETNVDVATGTQSERSDAIVRFLWSDRNTDPVFRSLPIYTDDRLRDQFRYTTVKNIARRLYRQSQKADSLVNREPPPGDYGLGLHRSSGTSRRDTPSDSEETESTKPRALSSCLVLPKQAPLPTAETPATAPDGGFQSSVGSQITGPTKEDQDLSALPPASTNKDTEGHSLTIGGPGAETDSESSICEVWDGGGKKTGKRTAKEVTDTDPKQYTTLPPDVLPLKFGTPPFDVRLPLPSLHSEISLHEVLQYGRQCNRFDERNPNTTPHHGFVADDPALRIGLDLRLGHFWRLRNQPYSPKERRLWKRHVLENDDERYLNTEVVTSCMYLFNQLVGPGRNYHCFGSLLTQYFFLDNHITDGSHATLRAKLMGPPPRPRTRGQDKADKGIMRLPPGLALHDFDYLFFPFNPGTIHWHVVVADTRNRLLLDFDSSPRHRVNEREHVTALRHFLDEEWNSARDGDRWKSVRPPCMRQKDSQSCGVHTIANTLVLLAGCDPASADFSSDQFRILINRWLMDGKVSINNIP